MLSDNDIGRIAARIANGIAPIAVGIFGSYAVGKARDDSDLDLFVIHRTPLSRAMRRRQVSRQLVGVMHPLDIHVFTPEEFEAECREELSFGWVIARQARLLYRRYDLGVVVPSLNHK